MTTNYHPVTKEEHCNHEYVCNWWAYHVTCDALDKSCHCQLCEHDTRIHPDPLALLEAWREYAIINADLGDVWDAENDIVKRLRENPDAVRQQGVKEGWLNE